MQYKIFDIDSSKEWISYLSRLPELNQDIYFDPRYYKISQKSGCSSAECFVYSEGNDFILYPYLKRSLKKLSFDHKYQNYFDIEGAYGLNGAASNAEYSKERIPFFNNFSNTFKNYCIDNNIIAEFTRFNSLYKNHKYFTHTENVKINESVIINLSHKNLMKDRYEHSVRKNIKKAERNNLYCTTVKGSEITEEQLEQFINIYEETMLRNQASNFFYFDKKFYNNMNHEMGDDILYFFIYKDKKCVSTELVLKGRKVAYSYLGGTNSEYYVYGANVFLKHNIIKYLKNEGLEYFYLGGGMTIGDEIFNYKKKFSKNGVIDFFVGKKIHNKNVYNDIMLLWEKNNSDKIEKYKNILTRYWL